MDKEAKKRYNEYVETVTPTHNLLSQMLRAFLTGGIICTMGQGLRNVFTYFFDMDKVTSSTWVSITLIFISVRWDYINSIKARIGAHLDNMSIKYPDGTIKKVKKANIIQDK